MYGRDNFPDPQLDNLREENKKLKTILRALLEEAEVTDSEAIRNARAVFADDATPDGGS